MKHIFVTVMLIIFSYLNMTASNNFDSDTISSPQGNIVITFIGHGTLMIGYNNKIIHIDPWSELADYSAMPKADIILITHFHPDHLDQKAIETITKKKLRIFAPANVIEKLKKGIVMKNGDQKVVDDIRIEAVPAYNTTKGREQFHPKGRDNGYVLNIGGKRIYIAGDTENIPEMANLKNIDIAFLPMNQPYTMLPEQVADAASKFNPKILYPYHYGTTELSKLTELMSNNTKVKVIFKSMK